MIEGMQPPLFETESLSDSRLFAKTELINFDRNLAVAFGVTKTGLNKGSYGVLENIFIGMRNLEIPLEMLSIQNPVEILSNYSATGYLKRRKLHLGPNIPNDFLELVKYINSFETGFTSLAKEFKDKGCFDMEPKKRLELLEPDVRKIFVESFLADYKSPFNDFDDPNLYGEDKGIYAKIIYEELKSLSERAQKLLG